MNRPLESAAICWALPAQPKSFFHGGRLRATADHRADPIDKADDLARDLGELLNSLNRAGPASLVVPSEYLEIVVIPH